MLIIVDIFPKFGRGRGISLSAGGGKEDMLRVSEDGRNRRREGYVESYRQLGRSLLELERAADRIFDAISERTANEREKLTGISRRIQTAKARIDAISRTDDALIVTSPSWYPSSCITEEDFHPLFPYKDEESDVQFPVKLLVNGGLNREFEKDGTMELFQFFSEENIGHESIESQPKVTDKLTHLNEKTFLGDLLETFKSSNSGYHGGESNSTDLTMDFKKQDLPPLPPSLLLHNIPSLQLSNDFKLIPPVNRAPNIEVPGVHCDVTHKTKDDHSEVPKVSDFAARDLASTVE